MQKPRIVKAIWLNATARNWQQIWSKVIWLLHAMLHLQTKESPIHDCLWARKSHGKRKISLKLPVFKIIWTLFHRFVLTNNLKFKWLLLWKKTVSSGWSLSSSPPHYPHHQNQGLRWFLSPPAPSPLLPLINVLPPSKPSRSFISAVSFKFQITTINS